MNAGRLAACLVIWISAFAHAGAPASSAVLPYDTDPRHLWNRLSETLFSRAAPDGERYGVAELDILFWANTKHILTSPSRERAAQVMDEFIRRHGERLISEPAKRAMLQRDLWALFDWSANPWTQPAANTPKSLARIELQQRLVTIMKRLALPAQSIDRLPDNYADADRRFAGSGFPNGLFAPDGAWQLVGRTDGAPVPEHATGFGGRSVFMVFVKFPEGREPALKYLKELRDFVPALIYANASAGQSDQRRELRTNAATPQFPAGTQWALVRRLLLIDDRGEVRASPWIESIQMRTYAAVPGEDSSFDAIRNAQTVAEYQMDRSQFPALRAVESGERDFQFVHFRSMGVDPFERGDGETWRLNRDRVRDETLRTCSKCHFGRGILSVNTYSAFGTAGNPLEGSSPEREAKAAMAWKTRRFEWGLLRGLWQTSQ